MKTVTRTAVVLAVASFAIFVQACTLASPTHVTEVPASADADSSGDASSTPSAAASPSAGSTAAACTGASFTKVDTSTLTACGSGKGHCYGTAKVPVASLLGADTCSSDQVCVPDEILAADGNKLTTCSVSALGGKPGGCITIDLLPQLKAQGSGALTQDVCQAGQVCAPCNDPTNNNAATPFCENIGVMDKDCASTSGAATTATTPAPAAACCTTNGVSNGQCLPSSAVPSGSASLAPQDTCATGNSCVPKALVSGTPKTCSSDLNIFGGSAICLDVCFASGIEGKLEGVLGQDGCGATERCIPCSFITAEAGSTPVPGCN